MPHKILQEDWSDYDNKKKKGVDSKYFSCEENWEREYLKNKIKKVYPQYTDANINHAIDLCCKSISAPRLRTVFVDCVMKRLRGLL
jgi:hypothetical protein